MEASVKLTVMICLAVGMMSCRPASAHNLFVIVTPKAGAADTISVVFEHAPKPGKGGYNKPLLTRGKTWVRKAGEKKSLLKLKEVENGKNKHLQSATEIRQPRVIVHSVKWGIYRGRLDYFYGKYVDASSSN